MAPAAAPLTPPPEARPGRARWRGRALGFWYDPAFRAALAQVLFALGLGWLLFVAIANVLANMRARGVPTGFGFLADVAGFDISQSLIPYSAASTYGRAFLVGLLNTCLVAAISLVLASVIGFAIGIARLSKNWAVSGFAAAYVEALRNVPLLLQLLFWYNAVLKALPAPRQSYALPFGVYLNNRGLVAPELGFGPGALWFGAALVAGAVAALAARRSWARSSRRDALTALLIVGPPVAAFVIAGPPFSFVAPELKGFNFVGGVRLLPEFVALVLGLSLYTAAFIAEVARAGMESVPRGQSEAAAALGLSRGLAIRLVIAPQAMRLIIPLLTNQYLNLIKNSSLAVFIGYPDLVQVFAGTVLNQTGAAVQVIFITMAVYLAISLLASLTMNFYNRRFAWAER